MASDGYYDLYASRVMLTRIALYSTLGYLISLLGHGWDTTEFWCVLALFWASDQLTRIELATSQLAEQKRRQALHDNNKDTQ